ncbi:hypothetical protein BsWGS_26743 [Bradybaena similaris]
MPEDNGNTLPHAGDLTGEADPTTIFTTTSSQRLDSSEQTSSSSVKQKWRIRPHTPFRQVALGPLSNDPQQNNDKLSASKDPQQNNDKLSVSSNNMHDNDMSTSFLSLSGATAAGQTDDPHHKQTATPRKSMLASKPSLSKSPDIDEIKSVKFQKLDDYPDSHVFRNTRKKSKVWPVDSVTNIGTTTSHRSVRAVIDDTCFCSTRHSQTKTGTTTPHRSVRSVIADTCFGCRRHSQARAHKAPTSNDTARKKLDGHTQEDGQSSTPRSHGLCRCNDLSTQPGRRNHAMLIMLMSVIPVLALLIQNSIDLSEHRSQRDLHESVKERVLFSVETGNVIHQTQIERGMTSLYISTPG